MKLDENTLTTLGITKTEQCILEHLDEAKSIQALSKETQISRTGTVYALQILMHRGFVQKIKNKKRNIYIAISIDELANKIQDIKDTLLLKNNYRKGVRVKTSFENEFVIHVGTEEILPAYKRIASMNKNTRIKAIQHHRSWMDLIDKITLDQLVEFNRTIIKNKIILDGMLNESAYLSYQKEIKQDPQKHRASVESLKGRMADYTVFPDTFFNYDSEIWLFKNTSLIINWKEEVAIEISNRNMTGFLNDMFEFVKSGGRKIDHNKMVEGLLE